MPRTNGLEIQEIIRAALDPVLDRAAAAIAKAVAEAADARLARQASTGKLPGRLRGRRGAPRRASRVAEMTRWTADRRARRVPTFVIEATGLDTKKKIVARFGENATFQRGKPLPAPAKDSAAGQQAGNGGAQGPVSAKPPRIRKAAKA